MKNFLRKIFCRHKDTYSATCPFNKMTYTYCKKCFKSTKTKKAI